LFPVISIFVINIFGGFTYCFIIINPFKHSGVKWLHFKVFRHSVWALWHPGLSSTVPKCQKIKNGRLGQYGAECFGILIFSTVRISVGLKGLNKRGYI